MKALFLALICVQFSFASLRLMAAGDVMSHLPQANSALAAGSYEPQLAAISEHLALADYAIANLETPILDGKISGYPRFSAPILLASSLKTAGFNLLLTANNHSLDQGFAGVKSTIAALDEQGLAHVGSYASAAAASHNRGLVYAQVNGYKLAFLGYTYGTNGINIAQKFAVNTYPGNLQKIKADLAFAREQGADLIIVLIHWGLEYHHEASAEQKKLAQFLTDFGADLILGGHSHVLQPLEILHPANNPAKSVLVSYSLGNLISNQVSKISTQTTAILDLEFAETKGALELKSINYKPFFMHKDPAKPLANRLYLIDINNALADPNTPLPLRKKLKSAEELAKRVLKIPELK